MMRKNKWTGFLALVLVFSLAGCGTYSVSDSNMLTEPSESTYSDESITEPSTENLTESTTSEEEARKKEEEESLIRDEEASKRAAEEEARKKADSISMLNYLTVVSQEISSSKNNRIFLESAYSSLINNTYPNAIDVRTQAYLENLLDTLENLRMQSVKRDRLKYIYEQNRAKAIKKAIPNPIALLNVVQSTNYLKMAISVINMAANAYSNYTEYTQETDLQYLKDGWDLDDEEAREVHNTRAQTFSYMVDMVRNNNLAGDETLNESSVEEFVKWENEPNVTRRIEFLESKQKAYNSFGEYWLVLAKSYYEDEDYKNCIDAISTYESIGARIFRKDYKYSKVLTLAIVSMKEIYSENDYIKSTEKYLPVIIENSDISDWALNHFVTQTYLDLYARTKNESYLQNAYTLQKSVVNSLIDEQKKSNEAFLNEIQEEPIDKNASKKEKKEIENYNKMLKEQRKTELPPINEPLYINCRLLLAIANELGISAAERTVLEKMLHESGAALFLNSFIDAEISTTKSNEISSSSISITYEKGKISIPVVYLSSDSVIKTKVINQGNTVEYDDWSIEKVDRKSEDLQSFMAEYTSSSAKKHDYKDGDLIIVSVFSNSDETSPLFSIQFKASVSKKAFVFENISFERVF